MEIGNFSLGDLSDSSQYHQDIYVKDFKANDYLSALKKMILIRKADEKIAINIENGVIKCPCHLSIGQEAIPVGISKFLNKNDYVLGNHRSHGHYLAMGGSSYELLAEVLGKGDGCSKGMGGSMHLVDRANGFLGSVPIVAGTISLAVGAGLSAKIKKNGSIAVSYFGDGATEEGTFHESLNFASKYKVPTLFVCENNMFSSHMHISERQPASSISRFAIANKIPFSTIDGNDINEVFKTAKYATEFIREGNGPYLIEAATYRWRAHVGNMKDLEIGLHRRENYDNWLKRDPILRLFRGLKSESSLSDQEFEAIDLGLEQKIDQDWEKSIQADYPPIDQLSKTLFYSA
jgi:TPP-dependent pyruvate/acetoin dehydrogenase alpha subunit